MNSNPVAPPTGLVSKCLCQMALAHYGRPAYEQVAFLLHVTTGGQVHDTGAANARIEGEVEDLKSLGRVDAGATQSQR